jgi:tRNA(fMet)-specific endonuclease VapC
VKYLPDTNAFIAIMKHDPKMLDRMQEHSPSDFGMSSIVRFELLYGAFKSQRVEANVARVEAFPFEVLEFDTEDAAEAGKIRAQLAQQGSPIGPYDVMIAGQARARGLTLITHNTKEFKRVPGLRIEDWLA